VLLTTKTAHWRIAGNKATLVGANGVLLGEVCEEGPADSPARVQVFLSTPQPYVTRALSLAWGIRYLSCYFEEAYQVEVSRKGCPATPQPLRPPL
jgi:hypothetical protein